MDLSSFDNYKSSVQVHWDPINNNVNKDEIIAKVLDFYNEKFSGTIIFKDLIFKYRSIFPELFNSEDNIKHNILIKDPDINYYKVNLDLLKSVNDLEDYKKLILVDFPIELKPKVNVKWWHDSLNILLKDLPIIFHIELVVGNRTYRYPEI